MDDQQLWSLGDIRLKALLANLSFEGRIVLTDLLSGYRKAKESLAAVVAAVDAAAVCRECEGQCCQNGKYRMSVLDALARVVAQTPTSADFAQKPVCPYGDETGCTMEPGLRPADCVLFICDAIDQRLSPQARSILVTQEQCLRECIQQASSMTGEQMAIPLLLWAEHGGK
ncbi:MAG: hypothetical protein PHP95_15040 [Desulfuromonadaceae bacterium]|nr:hypothetical protein [Desulfuromonadaceae bacterium]MDD2849765.1 hypothetical protein [Desulfuromonadaceae bacterium]MDD4130735.1 hypothetical protein [Desulfuromonadaceae bacterium]